MRANMASRKFLESPAAALVDVSPLTVPTIRQARAMSNSSSPKLHMVCMVVPELDSESINRPMMMVKQSSPTASKATKIGVTTASFLYWFRYFSS